MLSNVMPPAAVNYATSREFQHVHNGLHNQLSLHASQPQVTSAMPRIKHSATSVAGNAVDWSTNAPRQLHILGHCSQKVQGYHVMKLMLVIASPVQPNAPINPTPRSVDHKDACTATCRKCAPPSRAPIPCLLACYCNPFASRALTDGDALCVDCAEVAVLQQVDQHVLAGLRVQMRGGQ